MAFNSIFNSKMCYIEMFVLPYYNENKFYGNVLLTNQPWFCSRWKMSVNTKSCTWQLPKIYYLNLKTISEISGFGIKRKQKSTIWRWKMSKIQHVDFVNGDELCIYNRHLNFHYNIPNKQMNTS